MATSSPERFGWLKHPIDSLANSPWLKPQLLRVAEIAHQASLRATVSVVMDTPTRTFWAMREWMDFIGEKGSDVSPANRAALQVYEQVLREEAVHGRRALFLTDEEAALHPGAPEVPQQIQSNKIEAARDFFRTRSSTYPREN